LQATILPRNVELSYLMFVWKLTKRHIYCQMFIKALNRKIHISLLMKTVAQIKWNQRNAWQMIEYCSSTTFLSLSSLQPSFSISCSTNYTKTKNNLQSKIPNNMIRVYFTMQNFAFSRYLILKKICVSDCQIRRRVRVTNREILVSFHKQHWVFLTLNEKQYFS
jgi:hypothetical protein